MLLGLRAVLYASAGLSQGHLQKLQGDVAKWSGLAALLAHAAGWRVLEPCLARLSQQAEAGVHPHLLLLMQVHTKINGNSQQLALLEIKADLYSYDMSKRQVQGYVSR